MTKARHRKVSCPDCGYAVRMARSWMLRGLPCCPCGQTMRPDAPADLALLGLIGPDDMSQAAWNAIARENGWEILRNHGQGARLLGLGSLSAPSTPAAFCVFPGCGKWIADGAERCAAGHPQHADVPAVEAIPF
jgi:hypothetical protein